MRNRINRIARKLTVAAIIAGLAGWLPLSALHARASASALTPIKTSAELPALQGEQAVQELKEQGLYDSLEEAVSAARYEMRWEEQPMLKQAPPCYHAPNPAQRLNAYFTTQGLQLGPQRARSETAEINGASEQVEWQAEMKLIGYGYGKNLMLVGPAELVAEENRIEYRRGELPLTEWYINKAEGLEQGFTLESRPGDKAKGKRLKVVLEVSGDLRAESAEQGRAIALKQADGEVVLRYGELHAYDAEGRVLRSEMKVSEGRVVLEVEEDGAVYPVTIDPLFTQQAKLIAGDGALGDLFGSSIAISDHTVVVGAAEDEIDSHLFQGSAYVFVPKDGKTWTRQKLTASDGTAFQYFGVSVAINGNTVVVGASGNSWTQGSAYVFVLSGTTWSEEQKLTPSDGAIDDDFGLSVAISGETVVVGAHEVYMGFFPWQAHLNGTAYVFVRSGTTWSQQQKLIANDGGSTSAFGVSVAIIGETVVVGVPGSRPNGSAHVFVRTGTIWSEQQKLTASDGVAFGSPVAISGETVVVGARNDDIGSNADQGSAYVFLRSGTTWSEQQKLTASDGATMDYFGVSVAISGETVVVGAYYDDIGSSSKQGSAYLFVRSGTTWSEQQKLIGIDGATWDAFGRSVAISGEMVVVGAYLDDIGSNFNQGSAYMFSIWGQQPKLTAIDGGAIDRFGSSVAISGNTIVVGAPYDDIGSNFDQGSAYLFVRSGTAWLQRKLTASDGAAGEGFGHSVAIFNDRVVVGAPYDDTGSNVQGSAYVFVRSGTIWSEQQKLTATDGLAGDRFGISVAIDNDTVVVGAASDDTGSNIDQGSAYIFVQTGTTWSEQQKLTASDGARKDLFGISVATTKDKVVVGASTDDTGSNTNQGSAYVFVRTGTTWSEQQKLTAGDGAADDYFGVSVAINADTVVVGAYYGDIGSNTNQGSAYVFVCSRTTATWSEQQKLTASDGAAGDLFGFSVGISGEKVVVGAYIDNIGSNLAQGSAYVFVRSGTSWSQQQKLTASDAAASDRFGFSVAISLNVVVVGAPQDDIGSRSDQGSAYVFVGP